jgi:hypothetical protein
METLLPSSRPQIGGTSMRATERKAVRTLESATVSMAHHFDQFSSHQCSRCHQSSAQSTAQVGLFPFHRRCKSQNRGRGFYPALTPFRIIRDEPSPSPSLLVSRKTPAPAGVLKRGCRRRSGLRFLPLISLVSGPCRYEPCYAGAGRPCSKLGSVAVLPPELLVRLLKQCGVGCFPTSSFRDPGCRLEVLLFSPLLPACQRTSISSNILQLGTLLFRSYPPSAQSRPTPNLAPKRVLWNFKASS